MIKEFLNLSKHTIIYGFGQVASRSITVLLVPLYTAYLTTSDYGILQITRVYNQLLLTLMLVGMSVSLFRVYFQANDEYDRKIILSTTFITYFIISLFIFTPIIWILSNYSDYLINIPESKKILWLVFISVFLEGFFTLQLAILRAKEKSKAYSLINLIRVIIYIGLILFFVVYLKKSYVGVIWAGIYSLIIINIIMIPYILPDFIVKISYKYLREIIGIGIPLCISLLGAWVLNLSDRYMIQYLMPQTVAMSHVGIYSLGDKLAQIVRFILVMPFMLTWGAQMYKYAEKKEAKNIYKKVMNVYFFIACLIGLFLSFFAKEILVLIAQNPEYYPAYKVVPFLTFSKILTGVILILSVGSVLTNHTRYVAISSFAAAILNVLFNFILIPRFDIMGAALGSLFAYFLNVIILYYLTQKKYYVAYDKWRILFFGVLILSVSVLVNYAQLNFVVKISIFILIILVSPIFKLVTYNNISNVVSYARKYFLNYRKQTR